MFVHGDNIAQKESIVEPKSIQAKYIKEIRARYNKWKAANEALIGPIAPPTPSDVNIIE